MQNLPAPQALILVAILPTVRDLEIARLLGWYRIPLRRAPKVVDVDYLAFYQTAAFGENDRWQIQSVAEVQGHELTTRAELIRDEPDHPHAREEYYKLQIGPLIPLKHPIVAERWRRLTFLYTTGEYLQQARTLNDLVVHSEDRDILWSSLRERALASGRYQLSGLEKTELDPEVLEWLGVFGILKADEDDQSLE
ncbi:MAG TPA: hypothetical protein VHO48_13680 [Anaerolineaceae bacterium]|nr:hypothetical protein [Anaerolineaceae bacterium]